MSEKKLKAAVVLSGCGHLDGTEVREGVLSLLVLDQQEVEAKCFAPDIDITQVIDHRSKGKMKEKRNVLVEAARIARGEICDIKEAKSEGFDMLVIPGGYGVVRNLSDLAENKDTITVLPEFEKLVSEFFIAKKPIGAICISPAIVAFILSSRIGKEKNRVKVTIGDDKEKLIERLGGEHIKCDTELSIEDEEHNVFSCSAYIRSDEGMCSVYQGIKHMIDSMVRRINKRS
ncbi:isoprenoid biosynthesis glyoxalase ElbB [Wolbachia endosymbiont of Cruorifilaria tuberocauda]|uniref:isoprenoid biosynthesis glyoxalase ElbB n=1 Tax=Wolbachia endosymbiont of Cruorifilaria tuberocauda TaxID=1812111 RepID=UPI00158A8DE2|nr:isoprenoid biosynthesis glyoxalase ElbB [Wolbachia endosymbiont of Cruorifilaria tuberocauda]QKX01512.1 isoprenoid biosynthesis glyoxalase ElbB [Wolbachia endosymbiont of Cruorifilaria tuberocauda]